jgi:drug/metabolite transporter (DMT)-like permease
LTRERISEVALIGVAAVWGLTFTMVQDAIERLPAMAFLGYRFTAAAILVALVFARPLRQLSADGWRAGLGMGAFLTAGYVFQTLGLEHTSASNAGFITGLFVVFTPLMAALVLRERIAAPVWAAAGVSALGLYLLSGTHGLRASGDGLEVLCALAFSAHILVTSRAARAHHPGALLVVQLGVCGLFCLAVAAAGGRLEAPHGYTVWSALAVTAVLASAVAFFVQTFAQRYAPPSRTALILAGEPAFAGLFGWLLAGDRLSALAWFGAALIMGAIVAVEVVPRFRPPRPIPEG